MTTTINFMKNYSNLNQMMRSIVVLCLVAIMTLTGCVKVDDTLGSGFIPGDQEMVIGVATLEQTKEIFETRLYQTDSVVMSNLVDAYLGSSQNDTMGLRSAGLIAQYMALEDSDDPIDSGYFGYRPIFDSIQIVMSIIGYGRDTITPQTFHVYEVTSNDYLKDSKDSIFYIGFDPKPFLDMSEPLFSFVFPNGGESGSWNPRVTMVPTQKGKDYVKRLMISNGDKGEAGYINKDVSYSVYDDTEEWLKAFKGLYIMPEKPDWTPKQSVGSVFTALMIDPEADIPPIGFMIYCRNRVESDPTLIKDTLAVAYYPYDFRTGDYLHTINTIDHYGYEDAEFDIANAIETNEDRPISKDIYVDGMGGVVTEITITENFFKELEAIIAAKNSEIEAGESGLEGNYRTLAFNKAELKIYFSAGDYDWNKIVASAITPLMNGSLSRLGLYTNYKKRTGIIDYTYMEENRNPDFKLPYGGYINRTQGCYQLNINGYIQGLWNSYLKEKEAGGEVDYSKIKNRSIYLAPQATELFGSGHAKLQGMENFPGKENAMKIELVYTLVK